MTFGVFLLYYLGMKKFLSIIVLFCLMLPASALTLQGNAQFNAEYAKEETFNNISYALGPNEFRDYWQDPNYISNYDAVQNGVHHLHNRYLVYFSDGTYGVRYSNDPYHNYYYNEYGELFKVDVLNKPYDVYPHRSVAYNKYGAFKNATYVVSSKEQYLYDSKQNLMGHWLDNACYDAGGNVLMLRKHQIFDYEYNTF